MTIYSINNHKKYGTGSTPSRRVSSLVAREHVVKDRFHSQRGSSMGIFISGLGILSIVMAAGFMYIFQITS